MSSLGKFSSKTALSDSLALLDGQLRGTLVVSCCTSHVPSVEVVSPNSISKNHSVAKLPQGNVAQFNVLHFLSYYFTNQWLEREFCKIDQKISLRILCSCQLCLYFNQRRLILSVCIE